MQRGKPPAVEWKLFNITHAGQRWSSCWEIHGANVHVFGAYGSDKAPLRGREPEAVAKGLLLKIVKAWLTR